MHDHYTFTMLPGHLPKKSQCKTGTKNASHATEDFGLYFPPLACSDFKTFQVVSRLMWYGVCIFRL